MSSLIVNLDQLYNNIFILLVFIMNKVFIALAIYGFAVAYAQPAQNQCEVQTTAALNLANLVERVSKGEGLLKSIFKS